MRTRVPVSRKRSTVKGGRVRGKVAKVSSRGADARVLTLHPAGKRGVRIAKATYDAMRAALLAVTPADGEGVAFADLRRLVRPLLVGGAFPKTASVSWYVVVVKQDLEARGLIEQVPGRRPQHVRRKAQRR